METPLNYSSSDSREHLRSRYSVPVQILFRNSESAGAPLGESMTCAVSYDISRSGMRLYSSVSLDDKEFSIRFAVPNSDPICEIAHVVRCIHQTNGLYEYGVQFAALLPEFVLIDIERESQRLSLDPEALLT